jgi:ABC-2 type transport system ATP-binding protein
MIHRGRMLFSAALDDVKAGHRWLTLQFSEPRPAPPAVAGVVSWRGSGREWVALCNARPGEFESALAGVGGRVVQEWAPSLDEIFVARVGAECAPAGGV